MWHQVSASGRYYAAQKGLFLDWVSAKAYCSRTYGTTLATVITNNDMQNLNVVSLKANINGNIVWVGLNDRLKEARFRWDSKTSCYLKTNKCTQFWKTSAPAEPDGSGDCSIYWHGWDVFGDETCSKTLQFICDVPAPTINPTIPTTNPTLSPTFNPSKTPSNTPSLSSLSPSVAPSFAPSLSPSVSPSNVPTNPPSSAPSLSPTMPPTNTPSFTPTFSPTRAPSHNPSQTPTSPPSNAPSHSPTIPPSTAPSLSPTMSPTKGPTSPPSNVPSHSPSTSPTMTPSTSPSTAPTKAPTSPPSLSPSLSPSLAPSNQPSLAPSLSPSLAPSLTPSLAPSLAPSLGPTTPPTLAPSFAPTLSPSLIPTLSPSLIPSISPSLSPTLTPSIAPSYSPTLSPTVAPTSSPTPTCWGAKFKGQMIASKTNNINDFLWGGQSFVSQNCRFLLTMKMNGNLELKGLVGKYESPWIDNKIKSNMTLYSGWKINTFIGNRSGQSIPKFMLKNGAVVIEEHKYKNVPSFETIEIWKSNLSSIANNIGKNELILRLTDGGCLKLNEYGKNIDESTSIWSVRAKLTLPNENNMLSTSSTILLDAQQTTPIDDNANSTQNEGLHNDDKRKLWWIWYISLVIGFVIIVFALFRCVKRVYGNMVITKSQMEINVTLSTMNNSEYSFERSEGENATDKAIELWMIQSNDNVMTET